MQNRHIEHSLGTPWARAAGAAVMVRGGCDCAKGRLGRQHSDSRHLASRACSAQGPLMRHRPNAGGVPCAQRYRRRPASDMLGSPSCSGRGTPSASRKRVIRIRCRGWRQPSPCPTAPPDTPKTSTKLIRLEENDAAGPIGPTGERGASPAAPLHSFLGASRHSSRGWGPPWLK